MRVVIAAKTLAAALRRLAPLDVRHKLPHFMNVAWFVIRNGALSVQVVSHSGMEGEIAISAKIVGEDCVLGFPLRHMARLAATLSGDVIIDHDGPDEDAVVKAEDFECRIELKSSEWFNPHAVDREDTSRLAVSVIREWLERVGYCISKERDTESMSCLYLASAGEGMVHACGLDGHQFSKLESRNPELASTLHFSGPVLIGVEFLKAIKSWLAVHSGNDVVSVAISQKTVRIRSTGETLVVPRSHYVFPDYMSFSSKAASGTRTIKVYRSAIREGLRRLALFAGDNNRGVYLGMENGELSLSVRSEGKRVASVSTLALATGDPKPTSVPLEDLLEMLGHFTGQNVVLTMGDTPGHPVQITGGDGDKGYSTIIMPLMIVEEDYYGREEAA
jgi:DNA polymerase III sliding clamp (beta) subunit (PCNA family)